MADKVANKGVVKYSATQLPLSSLVVSELSQAKGIKWVIKADTEDSELTAVPSG